MAHLFGKYRGTGFRCIDPKYRPIIRALFLVLLSNLGSADFYLTLFYVEVPALDKDNGPQQSPDASS